MQLTRSEVKEKRREQKRQYRTTHPVVVLCVYVASGGDGMIYVAGHVCVCVCVCVCVWKMLYMSYIVYAWDLIL